MTLTSTSTRASTSSPPTALASTTTHSLRSRTAGPRRATHHPGTTEMSQARIKAPVASPNSVSMERPDPRSFRVAQAAPATRARRTPNGIPTTGRCRQLHLGAAANLADCPRWLGRVSRLRLSRLRRMDSTVPPHLQGPWPDGIASSRHELGAYVDDVSDGARDDQPTRCSPWTVRDVTAHLAATFQRFHRMLDQGRGGDFTPPFSPEELDAENLRAVEVIDRTANARGAGHDPDRGSSASANYDSCPRSRMGSTGSNASAGVVARRNRDESTRKRLLQRARVRRGP